jgi:hypothetical protein
VITATIRLIIGLRLIWTIISPLARRGGRRKRSRVFGLEDLDRDLLGRLRSSAISGAEEAKLSFTASSVRELLYGTGVSRSGRRANELLDFMVREGTLTIDRQERLRTGRVSKIYSLTFRGFIERFLAEMQTPDPQIAHLAAGLPAPYEEYRLVLQPDLVQTYNKDSLAIIDLLEIAGAHFECPLLSQARKFAEVNPGRVITIEGRKDQLASPISYVYCEAAHLLQLNPPLPREEALVRQFEEQRSASLLDKRKLLSLPRTKWFKRAIEREKSGEQPFLVRISAFNREDSGSIRKRSIRELKAREWLDEQVKAADKRIEYLNWEIGLYRQRSWPDVEWSLKFRYCFLVAAAKFRIKIPKDEELSQIFRAVILKEAEDLMKQEKELRRIEKVAKWVPQLGH